jgi:AAA domain/DnaB-like helicase N terminal domain
MRKPAGKEGVATGPQIVRPRPELRDLPSAPELEKLILGGILASHEPNATFRSVQNQIPLGAYTLEEHRRMVCAMSDLDAEGQAITLPLIVDVLRRRGQLNGHNIISDYAGLPVIADIAAYCRRVAEYGECRKLYLNCIDTQMRITAGDSLNGILDDLKARLEHIHPSNGFTTEIDKLRSVHTIEMQTMEFVIDGLLAAGTLNAIGGEPGAGKSTFATALAGSVATGTDFLKRTVSQRPVVLLDKENPVSVMCERLRRLGIQDGGLFKIWGGWCDPAAPTPCQLADWVEATIPKPLIIVDSYRAFLEGDENDASIVRAFMNQCRHLADKGACVLLLHHPGKSEGTKEYRGSLDFKASIDTGYTLHNLGESMLDRLTLKAFKARFEVDRMVIMEYRNGHFRTDDHPAAIEASVNDQLTAILKANPGVTGRQFEELAAKAGLVRARARSYLAAGLEWKQIQVTRCGANVKRYELTAGTEMFE